MIIVFAVGWMLGLNRAENEARTTLLAHLERWIVELLDNNDILIYTDFAEIVSPYFLKHVDSPVLVSRTKAEIYIRDCDMREKR